MVNLWTIVGLEIVDIVQAFSQHKVVLLQACLIRSCPGNVQLFNIISSPAQYSLMSDATY